MSFIPPSAPYPATPEPEPPRDRTGRLAMLALVLVFAGMGVAISAATGRLDSALLFVGIPCALALTVGWIDTRDSASGTLFQITTVLLLLASALLHEGALCVLIAAPLVYGVVGLAYGAVSLARRGGTRHLGLLPLLVLASLEGVVPGMRLNAEQSSGASRIVGESCGDFEAALVRGPRIDAEEDRGLLLGLAQYPTPVAASGGGVAVGDAWETTDEGCRASLRIDYTRKLDPSLWFGPVTDLFMGAGAEAFLNSLD